jgi:serine/threonine protein kinase
MAATTSCPSVDELRQALLGRASEPKLAAVEQHLSECPACLKVCQTVAAEDTLVEAMRNQSTVKQPAGEIPGSLRGLMDRLRQLKPGEGKEAASIAGPVSAEGPKKGPPLPTLEAFGKLLADNGLVTAGDLAAVQQALPAENRPKDAQALGRLLIEKGKLTRFQVSNALQGKAKWLVFGEYLVLDQIGAGGMGQVFKAQHRRMERIVALKVLPPSSVKSPDSVKRFHREVKAAAKLEHPNIVTAYDAGEANGVHFLVMQYVDGQDLNSLVKKNGPMGVAQAVEYITQAACGLAYAHSEGVIHRDIKPGNLLVDKKGVLKILDMGLARIDDSASAMMAAQEGLTQSGQVMGTVDYMAPEQAFDTRQADARSDIYSLGCTLYRMLTGMPLYEAETLVQKILAHREQAIPSIRTRRPEVSEALEQVVAKMLAKKPAERYQTMNEVVAGLEKVAGTLRVPSAEPQKTAATSGTVAGSPARPLPVAKPLAQPAQAAVAHSASADGTRSVPATLPPRRNNRKLLIGAAAAGFIFLFAGVVIYIRNKDGEKLAEIKLEEAASVEIKATSDQPAAVPSPPANPKVNTSTAPPNSSDANRQVISWVLKAGGWARLKVDGNKVNVRDIKELPERPFQVDQIHLTGRPISNSDLTTLKSIAEPLLLTSLSLDGTQVTDAGLSNLESFKSLQTLNLKQTACTPTGIASIQAALPTTKIDWTATATPAPVSTIASSTGQTPPLAIAPFDATQAKAHQEAWAKHLGTQVETTNSIGMEFR